MFKIIHNMVGCHCTNPITQVAAGQEFHTQIDTDGYLGAICTEGGDPGTWRRFGKIS